MIILTALTNHSSIIFGVIFLGILFSLALIRQKESKRITDKYDKTEIILSSFGVSYFGQESKIKKPLRSIGAIVLLKDGLYYHARYSRQDIFIKGSSITAVSVTDFFKDKPLYQNIIAITFLTENGIIDRAAFKIPFSAKWINAVKYTLLNKKTGS